MKNDTHKYILRALFSLVIILIVWGFVTHSGFIKEFFLPTPLDTIKALIGLFAKQGFIKDLGVSVFRILAGFLIAALLGIPTGILVGLSKKAEAFIEPIVSFIRYTPIPAFIPLFILWFGIGELEKIVVIASSVFFQLVLMVANSVSLTPQEIIESAETLGATRRQIIYKVIYRYSSPRIFNDLRVSMGWAWSGLLLAEIVGSTSGIGFVIIQSQRLLQTGNVIAAIMVVGFLGLASDYIFKFLYYVSFPWATKADKYVRA